MKKVKYYYNTSSLRYEKIEVSWKRYLLQFIGFFCAALFFASIIAWISLIYIESPTEKRLSRELDAMSLAYSEANKDLNFVYDVLAELQSRDDNIYRKIFEAEPIPSSIRNAGWGGGNRFEHLEGHSNSELLISTAQKIETIKKRIYQQSKSYDEIAELIKNQKEMHSSIPAIRPLFNEDLKSFASGFGMRIHPIYKTKKMHYGVDLTAKTGTKIYATGKGKVVKVLSKTVGYGKYIVIDHGYGYETLYAHMSKFNVRVGDKVERGDVIGYVGNTGTSTAPHIHYEVIKNGTKVNPIYYFFNDLDPEEYQQIVELANRNNQSFD